MQRYKRWRWGKPLSYHWEGKLYFQSENGKCPNGYKHFLLSGILATRIILDMLSWSFLSVLLQLNLWMDLRGFHHQKAECGLALQLWATTATESKKKGDEMPAEQTLLWIASCCYLTDGKQHSARWPEDISPSEISTRKETNLRGERGPWKKRLQLGNKLK